MRLLGPLTVSRDGAMLSLPASRKVRALLAYLALAPGAVARSHLCDLLWDVPDDPRGELRWCLCKIRSLVDEPGRRRVDTSGTRSGSTSRTASSTRSRSRGRLRTSAPRLRPGCESWRRLFAGDFLDGLEIDRCPAFNGWLIAQRRRFRGCHAALLEQIVGKAPDQEALAYLEEWLELAPFDPRVHGLLLAALARHGSMREGDEHLAATTRLFEAEGLDAHPIRAAWRSARARAGASPGVRAVVHPAAAQTVGGQRDGMVAAAARRASLVVMPFVDRSAVAGPRGGTADALAHDVIARLAKLRSLFVIAQGTVFALHERGIGPEEAGRRLSVDYVVRGCVRRRRRASP